MTSSPEPSIAAPAVTIDRPLRDLLLALPALAVTPTGEIDYGAADPAVLVRIAGYAESALQIIHGGFSAIGLLYALAAPQIEAGNLAAGPASATGRLLVELGEFIAYAHALSLKCREYTRDYFPPTDNPDDEF